MDNKRITELINSKLNKDYFFEKIDKEENFLRAAYYSRYCCIWICPYYLELEYQKYIIENPIKQLINIRHFFFTKFPEFNNQLDGWFIAYNRLTNEKDDLSLRLNKLSFNENRLKLY